MKRKWGFAKQYFAGLSATHRLLAEETTRNQFLAEILVLQLISIRSWTALVRSQAIFDSWWKILSLLLIFCQWQPEIVKEVKDIVSVSWKKSSWVHGWRFDFNDSAWFPSCISLQRCYWSLLLVIRGFSSWSSHLNVIIRLHLLRCDLWLITWVWRSIVCFFGNHNDFVRLNFIGFLLTTFSTDSISCCCSNKRWGNLIIDPHCFSSLYRALCVDSSCAFRASLDVSLVEDLFSYWL